MKALRNWFLVEISSETTNEELIIKTIPKKLLESLQNEQDMSQNNKIL